MDRMEFMSLTSSEKAEVLNACIDTGMSQAEAMASVGINMKDLMMAQVFFSKTEGRFISNAVGGFSNFHDDATAATER